MVVITFDMFQEEINVTLVALRFTDKDQIRTMDVNEVFEVVTISGDAFDVPGKSTISVGSIYRV